MLLQVLSNDCKLGRATEFHTKGMRCCTSLHFLFEVLLYQLALAIMAMGICRSVEPFLETFIHSNIMFSNA